MKGLPGNLVIRPRGKLMWYTLGFFLGYTLSETHNWWLLTFVWISFIAICITSMEKKHEQLTT